MAAPSLLTPCDKARARKSPERAAGDDISAMTVTVKARRSAAIARAESFPPVREIPPVLRPGRFDSSWD
jgi:hypothetical protein